MDVWSKIVISLPGEVVLEIAYHWNPPGVSLAFSAIATSKHQAIRSVYLLDPPLVSNRMFTCLFISVFLIGLLERDFFFLSRSLDLEVLRKVLSFFSVLFLYSCLLLNLFLRSKAIELLRLFTTIS